MNRSQWAATTPASGRHHLAPACGSHVHVGVRQHGLGHDHGHLAARGDDVSAALEGRRAEVPGRGRSRARSGRTRRAGVGVVARRSARSPGWCTSRNKPRRPAAIGLSRRAAPDRPRLRRHRLPRLGRPARAADGAGRAEAALATVLRLTGVGLVCAGRTDTGVHARGQVVHADVDEDAGRVRRPSADPPLAPCCAGSTASSPPTSGYARGRGARPASTPASRRCGGATPTGSPTSPASSTHWPASTCWPGRGRSTWRR